MMPVSSAQSDAEIRACHPVMRQLRTHIADADEFLERVRRQQAEQGYQLAFAAEGDTVAAVAGYRLMENLSAGRVLYVDDLVTDEDHRRQGHGHRLLEWLTQEARSAGAERMDLDSGVQRHDAHKLYMAHGMDIVFYHFRMDVCPRGVNET